MGFLLYIDPAKQYSYSMGQAAVAFVIGVRWKSAHCWLSKNLSEVGNFPPSESIESIACKAKKIALGMEVGRRSNFCGT
jgi:hypothetical protein